MSSVLFDAPGPRALARQRLFTVISAVVFAALLGFVLYKFYKEGEFDAEVWEEMSQPNIWQAIWTGLLATLQAAVLAIVLAIAFGAVFAVGRLSQRWYVRIPAVVVIEFFRAVPVLLLMLFIFLAFFPTPGGYWPVVLGLMLYNGAVLAEVFRAGIGAVPRGQSEAAYAIGMRKSQVMQSILFPQATRIMLPAIISQCAVVVKDTALGGIVTYRELLAEGDGIAQFIGATVVPYTVIVVIFIAINYSLTKLAEWVERRMSRAGLAKAPQVDAGMDQTGGVAGA